MSIVPNNLNLPLKKPRRFDFLFILACFGLAAFIIKPTNLAGWVVTLLFVAPAFWFAFSGPPFLNAWASNQRYVLAEWLVLTLRLAVFFLVTKLLAPLATSLLAGWLHT